MQSPAEDEEAAERCGAEHELEEDEEREEDELEDLPTCISRRRGCAERWRDPISRKVSQTSVYLQEWDIPYEQLQLDELIGKVGGGEVVVVVVVVEGGLSDTLTPPSGSLGEGAQRPLARRGGHPPAGGGRQQPGAPEALQEGGDELQADAPRERHPIHGRLHGAAAPRHHHQVGPPLAEVWESRWCPVFSGRPVFCSASVKV